MAIETFTPEQVEQFRKLDSELATVARIKNLKVRSETDQRYYDTSNNHAFDIYCDLTRHIFLEEGKIKILVDEEAKLASRIYLESHGFNQWMG